MTRPRKLNAAELRKRLAALPNWSLVDGKLHRELRFDDFAQAFAFMSGMALVSESMKHHPEWSNVWNRVVIDLTTHDAGGVSALDFKWAERANQALGT